MMPQGSQVNPAPEDKKDEKWLQRVLRENFLARWMQDDADAAMKWFRSPDGQDLSMRETRVEGTKTTVIDYPVEPAVSCFPLFSRCLEIISFSGSKGSCGPHLSGGRSRR